MDDCQRRVRSSGRGCLHSLVHVGDSFEVVVGDGFEVVVGDSFGAVVGDVFGLPFSATIVSQLQAQQKLIDQDREEERFAFVEGYLMFVQLAERRHMAKLSNVRE